MKKSRLTYVVSWMSSVFRRVVKLGSPTFCGSFVRCQQKQTKVQARGLSGANKVCNQSNRSRWFSFHFIKTCFLLSFPGKINRGIIIATAHSEVSTPPSPTDKWPSTEPAAGHSFSSLFCPLCPIRLLPQPARSAVLPERPC